MVHPNRPFGLFETPGRGVGGFVVFWRGDVVTTKVIWDGRWDGKFRSALATKTYLFRSALFWLYIQVPNTFRVFENQGRSYNTYCPKTRSSSSSFAGFSHQPPICITQIVLFAIAIAREVSELL